MPMPELTAAQRRAVTTLDRDVCVSAGAGSGKTRVLVERFCHIVESGQAGVGEILTVTFTEKAAREMKERIVRRFAQLARESEGELRRRREQDRRDVEIAYIGTIHGFCARVLRENALEAGIDPRFTVLDAPAGEALRREALEDALVERHDTDPTGSAELADALGLEALRAGALALHNQMRRLGRSPADLRFDPQPPLEERAADLAAAVRALTNPPAGSQVSSTLAAKLAALTEAWRGAGAALGAGPSWEALEAVRDVAGAIDKKGAAWTKPLVDSLRAAADAMTEAIVGHLAAEQMTALRALVESLDRRHRERKDAIGALDYDDLLILTRDLLAADSPTAQAYRRAIKFILMDEFQDTNRLQMEVIDAIRRPDGNLFIVGDAKQSIFGFNDAEVTVFLERRDAMQGDDPDGDIPLTENFRSRPGLIGFVNKVCAKIWEEDDFPFEALAAKRKFAADSVAGPQVEVFALPGDGMSADDIRGEEARALAWRIRQLVGAEGEAALRLTRADDQRNLRYGDILVLFRATTAVPIYERALFDAGVPYYVVSGRGFYSTPEVQNLANLLRVVHQPLDDYALAAVLRSPLCEVSDDTLYWLARAGADGRKPGRLWRGLSRAESTAQIVDEQRERLLGLRALIQVLQDIAPTAQFSRMIDHAIEATDYGAKMLAQSAGKRRYANVRKLIEVAQQVEGDTGFCLAEFLDYLSSLAVLAEREAEAPTEAEQSNVVRLMTIHMAKGLEAPVVFLADLGREMRPRPGRFLIDDEGRLAIMLRNPLTEQWLPTSDHGRAVEQIKRREAEESKRLFYVALTRAEERLVLVGGFGFKEGRSEADYRDLPRWSDWIEKALPLDEPCQQERHLDVAPEATVSVRSATSGPPPDRSRHPHFRDRHRARLEAGEPITEVPPDASATADQAAACAGWALPAAAGPPPRISVTALLDYAVCPRLYWLRYVLGVAEGYASQVRGGVPLGLLAHEALAGYDFAAAPSGARAVEDLDCDARTRARIAEMIDRFRRMPVFREIQDANERHPEIRFDLRAEGTIIAGVLDLLYRGPARRWTVLDYKTGELDDALRNYDLQVAIYAHAVTEITGDRAQEVILLPLSGGEAYRRPVDDALLGSAQVEVTRLIAGIGGEEFGRTTGPWCERCPYAGRWCGV